MRYQRIFLSSLVCIAVCFVGCTEPGRTTGVGAATGGVIGAGLGAIVGNQTGSTGSGLVVGALAGSAAGAAVGNSFEAQEKKLAEQDEVLARQEKLIETQTSELGELRREGDSPVSARRDSYSRNAPVGARSTRTSEIAGAASSGSIRSRDLIAGSEVSARGSLDWDRSKQVAATQGVSGALSGGSSGAVGGGLGAGNLEPRNDVASRASVSTAPECKDADQEVVLAKRANDISDQLFHYRRALRLCPSNPSFHNHLGELYLSLNRLSDAEFEFKEALRIDPGFGLAQDNLRIMQNRNRG